MTVIQDFCVNNFTNHRLSTDYVHLKIVLINQFLEVQNREVFSIFETAMIR